MYEIEHNIQLKLLLLIYTVVFPLCFDWTKKLQNSQLVLEAKYFMSGYVN
jgi:hypothetical protein